MEDGNPGKLVHARSSGSVTWRNAVGSLKPFLVFSCPSHEREDRNNLAVLVKDSWRAGGGGFAWDVAMYVRCMSLGKRQCFALSFQQEGSILIVVIDSINLITPLCCLREGGNDRFHDARCENSTTCHATKLLDARRKQFEDLSTRNLLFQVTSAEALFWQVFTCLLHCMYADILLCRIMCFIRSTQVGYRRACVTLSR